MRVRNWLFVLLMAVIGISSFFVVVKIIYWIFVYGLNSACNRFSDDDLFFLVFEIIFMVIYGLGAFFVAYNFTCRLLRAED